MVKLADEYKIALEAVIDPSSTTLQTSVENLSKTLKPIELKINTSNVESKLKSIKTQIESLSKMTINLGQGRGRGGVSSTSVSQQTQAYRELLSVVSQIDRISMKTSGMKANGLDVSGQVQQMKEYRAEFERLTDELSQPNISKQTFKSLQEQIATLKNQVVSLNAELSKVYSNSSKGTATKIGDGGIADLKLTDARTALGNDIDVWLQQNSAAAKTFGARLQEIKAQIQSADAIQLQHLKREFQDVTKQAQLAGVAGKTLGDQFKQSLKTVGSYFSAAMLITRVISLIRNAVTTVVSLDSALVDLRKTTTATNEELKSFYYEANDTAKQLGVTTQAVIQAAAEWSRLGYSIKDAETMAKTSAIFSSISPNVDIEKATDGLVSAMKAFDIEANDALDGIASKVNAIGNTQAVSNENIIDFLTRSSSAMKEANNTLDETIALGTAA